MLSEDDKIDLSSVAVTELQKCLEKSGGAYGLHTVMIFQSTLFSNVTCIFVLHILIFVFMYISFNSLRPSDAYMHRQSYHHWFR